jgi:hypothetical protein
VEELAPETFLICPPGTGSRSYGKADPGEVIDVKPAGAPAGYAPSEEREEKVDEPSTDGVVEVRRSRGFETTQQGQYDGDAWTTAHLTSPYL